MVDSIIQEQWEWVFLNENEQSNCQVSNLGNIRSFSEKRPYWYNRKLYKGQTGYTVIGISHRGKMQTRKVHCLVAAAFLTKVEGKTQVNHKNGNKQDNRVENLEWCTPSENVRHSFDTGLKVIPKKSKHYSAKPIGKYKKEVLVKSYGCPIEAAEDGYSLHSIYKAASEGYEHAGFYWRYLQKQKTA